ncbi:unnamed protein product (macronuclear) [Paramecium tetraurelia]|uniref:LisH domain-containing protein n=1 Tax=Paramecium tetraurelia TaxID=5888 RepID=A0BEA8_PARTE|nr:uncharacterized protein GSPATT00027908001 [Paramecium tetraurelia]CAK56875.1 unnamed protein product [Paramecium tetraurelia]|eukprot:XP_001424273.1 hypothetical protein (macronuclear) [Paramecium tetraurelia strain d4-2]
MLQQHGSPEEIVLCFLFDNQVRVTKTMEVVLDHLSKKGNGEWGIYDYIQGYRVHENNIQNSNKLWVFQLKDMRLILEFYQKHKELIKTSEELREMNQEMQIKLKDFNDSTRSQAIQQNTYFLQNEELKIKINKLENQVKQLTDEKEEYKSIYYEVMAQSEEFRKKLENVQVQNTTLKSENEQFKVKCISLEQQSFMLENELKQKKLQNLTDKTSNIQGYDKGIQSIPVIQTKSNNKSKQIEQQNKKLHQPSSQTSDSSQEAGELKPEIKNEAPQHTFKGFLSQSEKGTIVHSEQFKSDLLKPEQEF